MLTVQEKLNLEFFDKFGYNLNLEYNIDLGYYTGTLYIPTTSIHLFSVEHIFIYDKFLVSGNFLLGKFQSNNTSSELTEFWTHWDSGNNDADDEIFLFIPQNIDEYNVTKFVNEETDENNFYSGITENGKITNNITKTPNRINIGFHPLREDVFEKTLVIRHYNQVSDEDEIIAKILIHAESEGEDSRYSDMLTNFGNNIPQSDFKIFSTTNPNEYKPDFTIINSKRKEFLVALGELKNYEMSYLGLINIIKFYGYNLGIKEYWQNVNEDSPNFKMFKLVSVLGNFSENLKQIQDLNFLSLPNKLYKKTNFLKLVYNINRVVSGEVDNEDLPLTEETSEFELSEVLQKLYLLKKKLTNKYLPIQRKIIDITAEGDYFSKLETVVNNVSHRIDEIVTTETPILQVLNGSEGRIEDLRVQLFEVDSIFNLVNSVKPTIAEVSALGNMLDLEQDNKFDLLRVRNQIISGEINNILNDNFTLFKETFLAYFINNEQLSLYSDNKQTVAGHIADLKLDYEDLTYNDLGGITFSEIDPYFTFANFKFGYAWEVKWEIIKNVTNDSPNTYNYEITGPITGLNKLKVILPYVGTYNVNVTVYDLYGGEVISFNPNAITVIQNNVEFLAWYKQPYKEITFADVGQLTHSEFNPPFNYAHTNPLTFLELGKLTFRSLKQAKYAQTPQYNELDSYTHNNLKFATFADTQHLTHDNTCFAKEKEWVTHANFNYPHFAVGNITFNELNYKKFYSDSPATFHIFSFNNVDDTASFPLNTVTEIGNNIRITNDNETITLNYGLLDVTDLVAVDNFVTTLRNTFLNYEFNPVYEFDASPIPVEIALDWIVVTAKSNSDSLDCTIDYWTSKVDGTNYNNNNLVGIQSANALLVDPKATEIGILGENRKEFKNYSQLIFNIDSCQIPGKRVDKWILKNLTTTNTWELNNVDYFTHLFTEIGEYSLEIYVSDTNNNKKVQYFNNIVKINK